MEMNIEILYFDGCPNHGPTLQRVQELLREESMSAEISQILVCDPELAREIGFLGSPSVRVNGLDVEPAARAAHEYGMMCRTYVSGAGREGLPSRELIRQALREAESGVLGHKP
jgi:hypothetical protein